MNRRAFVAGSVGVLAMPFIASAEQAAKVAKVGILFESSPMADMTGAEPRHVYLRAFIAALRHFGYVEGRNIVVERRTAEGYPERLPALARELTDLHLDAIVTTTSRTIEAARQATTSIPIVLATGPPNVVEQGIVKSLGRPSTNVTGVTLLPGWAAAAKRLELLRELAPGVSRVAVVGRPEQFDEGNVYQRELARAARALGVALVAAPVKNRDDFPRALETARLARADAIFATETSENFVRQQLLIDFAAKQHLPAVYPYPESALAGGLVAYATDYADLFRRAAGYVDKILKGANPAVLPVEQPATFRLIVNLKTARALGLTVPPALLARADQVIE